MIKTFKHVWSSFIRFQSMYYFKLKIHLSELRSDLIRILFTIFLHLTASQPIAGCIGIARVLQKKHPSFHEIFPYLVVENKTLPNKIKRFHLTLRRACRIHTWPDQRYSFCTKDQFLTELVPYPLFDAVVCQVNIFNKLRTGVPHMSAGTSACNAIRYLH